MHCELNGERTEQLVDFLLEYHQSPTPPNQRRGQFLFNMLNVERPDLAANMRARDVDPFYRNDLIDRALAWIIANWG